MDKEKLKKLSRMADELNRELTERQRNTDILKRELSEIKRKNDCHVQPVMDGKAKALLTALIMKISARAQENGKVRMAEFRKKLQTSDTPKKISRASLVSNRRNRVML